MKFQKNIQISHWLTKRFFWLFFCNLSDSWAQFSWLDDSLTSSLLRTALSSDALSVLWGRGLRATPAVAIAQTFHTLAIAILAPLAGTLLPMLLPSFHPPLSFIQLPLSTSNLASKPSSWWQMAGKVLFLHFRAKPNSGFLSSHNILHTHMSHVRPDLLWKVGLFVCYVTEQHWTHGPLLDQGLSGLFSSTPP